jgi:hypothetical protein
MDAIRQPFDSLSQQGLRDLEALLVGYGFHPIKCEKGAILLRPDRVFCLCCGERVNADTFVATKGFCPKCEGESCSDTETAAEFFNNHNKIGYILRTLVS